MKKLLCAVVLALAAGCGSDSKSNTPDTSNIKPAGYVAVNFTVDDTANKVWKSGELEWKGAMAYDATTRVVTANPSWDATLGWATLYDDGPWTQGGHEPIGSTAGDHKLGVTVFVKPPASGTDTYEYGLRDATNPDKVNGGWVWIGSNGSYQVPAGATADINAPGLSFPAHGTTDLQIVVDANALIAGTWDTSKVTVKGSAWGWTEVTMVDNGTKGDATANDKKFTFVLSQAIDQTKAPYPGLLKSGDKPEFVVVFNGKEYKDTAGLASPTGVTAGLKTSGATTFTSTPVTVSPKTGDIGGGNDTITVP